jgi:hypothetical protein
MGDEGTFCTTAEVERKAGASCSATSKAEGYTNQYVQEAEGLICAAARYDFVTNYASLSTIGKEMLRELASCLAAIYVISYDMSGFTTRSEAEDMINILRDAALRGLSLLRDKKVVDFIIGG